MKFVHYTNSVSAHQLPLDRELLARIGEDAFRYVTANVGIQENQAVVTDEPWVTTDVSTLESCETLLVGGLRPIDVMERRLNLGKPTLYMSERWFKPIVVFSRWWMEFTLPGWLRLLVPSYFSMARRFVKLFDCAAYRFLPIGPWARRDMKLLCRFMGCAMPVDKVVDWGDFVAPTKNDEVAPSDGAGVRVLWVGRMLDWKRVDTLVMAIAEANRCCADRSFALTIVGKGPEETRLRQLSAKLVSKYGLPVSTYRFLPQVPIEEIRLIMRAHDVYVLPSNAYEGWGCVVNEALEEGMNVLGTFEAGASAALLPSDHLFHSGDWRSLSRLLVKMPAKSRLPYAYSPRGAAERLLEVCEKICG